MSSLNQGFDCELSDRFMSCKVAKGHLKIDIWNYEESADVSLSFDQVIHLIEYLGKIKSEVVGTIAPEIKEELK